MKDTPNMVNKRLRDLSCNQEEYEKPNSLNESGYETTITCT